MDNKQFMLNMMWGVLVISIIAITVLGTKVHEDAHMLIAKNHGCIQGHTEYSIQKFTYKGEFICEEYIPRSLEVQLQERYLHGMNEIVSYSDDKIVNTLMMLGTLLVMATNVFVLRDNKKVKRSES
jgi:hypothetical protein